MMKDQTEAWPQPLPYPERSGVRADEYIERIVASAGLELDEESYEETRKFASSLFKGQLGEIQCDSERDLEQLYRSEPSDKVIKFYRGYFGTEDGAQALLSLGLDQFSVGMMLNSRADLNDKKKIAADSTNWFKQKLADQLARPSTEDTNFQDELPASINFEPEKLVTKVEDLQAYRRFYRSVRAQVKQLPDSSLKTAEEILLTAHRGRVNEMVARLYKDVVDLIDQSQEAPIDASLLKRVEAAMPVVKATFLHDREEKVYGLEELSGNFFRRLDFLRNGAAWDDSDDYTPISQELSSLAVDLKSQTEKPRPSELSEAELTKWRDTTWSAENVKELAETVLGQWGLLSQHQADWLEIEERDGPAADGKWQVIISAKVRNMSVDGAKRVYRIPEKYAGKVLNEYPAGSIQVVAHELEHVIQFVVADVMAEAIPLAKINGRHTGPMKELGTIDQERIINGKIGAVRNIHTHYLTALAEKLRGGTRAQVARKFYESYMDSQPDDEQSRAKARFLAADRTSRFYNHGGYSSADLSYIEQELIRRQLEKLTPEDQQKVLILGSVFDLPDLSRLISTGLIKFPDGLPYNVAEDVWAVFKARYISPES